jgi:hypothetical protein
MYKHDYSVYSNEHDKSKWNYVFVDQIALCSRKLKERIGLLNYRRKSIQFKIFKDRFYDGDDTEPEKGTNR